MATRTLTEAESALRSGGLSGRTLEMALTSLRNSYATGQTPAPNQTPARNLNLSSERGFTSDGQNITAQATPDPYAIFNQNVMSLLTRHQNLSTRRFQEQEFNARGEQNKRVSKKTDPSLIGASPGIQNQVRSAQAGALDPTIAQAQQATHTFGERISNVRNAIDDARVFKSELEAGEEKKRQRAADIVELAIAQGSEALGELLRTSPELFKSAGYNTKEFEAVLKGLKAKETEEARRFNITESRLGEDGTTELTAAQRTAKASLDAVIGSLESYRALYDSLVEESGGQLIGTRAGSLSGAYNTLLFLIAQAAGTGALQAADREVVEAMIPNPTSVQGAFGARVRGGKQGGLNSIDEARKLFALKREALITGEIPSGEDDPLGIL